MLLQYLWVKWAPPKIFRPPLADKHRIFSATTSPKKSAGVRSLTLGASVAPLSPRDVPDIGREVPCGDMVS